MNDVICSIFSTSGSRGHSQEPGGVSEKHYRPVFRKIPADMDVQEGQLCRFDSVITGRPMPDISWYRDNVQVCIKLNFPSLGKMY